MIRAARPALCAILLILGAASARAAEPVAGVATVVTARATVMHPARLQTDPQSPMLVQPRLNDAPVTPRQTTRPCDTDTGLRCLTVVFDLP
jgi:hypothetical protein